MCNDACNPNFWPWSERWSICAWLIMRRQKAFLMLSACVKMFSDWTTIMLRKKLLKTCMRSHTATCGKSDLLTVRHVVCQGIYESSDIAVLMPYTGQLQKLHIKMHNEFKIVLSKCDKEVLVKDEFINKEVLRKSKQSESKKQPLKRKKLSNLLRITTVNNFQREEAKIIIISLVQSNKEKRVRFLKTTNRINVLLSRAQHEIYLIDNTDTYFNIFMWAKVLEMLQATDSVSTVLGLCCSQHPDTEIQVRQLNDFVRLSPEEGCQLACDRCLLRCSHSCLTRCHFKSMHKVFSCS